MRLTVLALFAVALGAAFWWYGSSYIVTHEAAKIAGDRPYCLSVAGVTAGHYDAVTHGRQLAFAYMWAGWSDFGGSRGSMQTTNHALLILADPSAVMNWSYKAMTFVAEPMLSVVYDDENSNLASAGRHSCVPRQGFSVTLS